VVADAVNVQMAPAVRGDGARERALEN
jgi:hypothetical protein